MYIQCLLDQTLVQKIFLEAMTMEVIGLTFPWPFHDPVAALNTLVPHRWRKMVTQARIEDIGPRTGFSATFDPHGTFQMTISRVATVADASGRTVAVYVAEPSDLWPEEVKQYRTFCFRDIPQGTLVLSFEFVIEEELFEATITTMSGHIIDRPAIALGPGHTVTMQELSHLAKEAALAAQLTMSYNQDIRMLLGQTPYELPPEGIFWSHAASFGRPRRRLWQKANLSRLRLMRWIAALQAGNARIGDDPAVIV